MKRDLVKRRSDYLEEIDILSLHPKRKINILTKFVSSKLRWDLTIYHFPKTWIVQNLDNKANDALLLLLPLVLLLLLLLLLLLVVVVVSLLLLFCHVKEI